jgi:hypothetical protein
MTASRLRSLSRTLVSAEAHNDAPPLAEAVPFFLSVFPRACFLATTASVLLA